MFPVNALQSQRSSEKHLEDWIINPAALIQGVTRLTPFNVRSKRLQYVLNFNSSFQQVNEGIKVGTLVHELPHQLVTDIANPRCYFDASSNSHLLDQSDPAGPNKYRIYRFTNKHKRQGRSLVVLQNISLSEAGGSKTSQVSIIRLAISSFAVHLLSNH